MELVEDIVREVQVLEDLHDERVGDLGVRA